MSRVNPGGVSGIVSSTTIDGISLGQALRDVWWLYKNLSAHLVARAFSLCEPRIADDEISSSKESEHDPDLQDP